MWRWLRMCGRLVRHDLRPDSPDRRWLDHWVLGRPDKPELVALHLNWVFTFILAVFAVQAWRDGKETTAKLAEQADAAKGQLEELQNEQRPWLTVDSAKITDFEKFYNVSTIYLSFNVTNVGRGIAKGVTLFVEPILFSSYQEYDAQYKKGTRMTADICAAQRNTALRSGGVMFPNQTAARAETFDDSDEQKQGSIMKYLKNVAGPPMLILGCVDYFYDGDAHHHQTSFALLLNVMKASALDAPVVDTKYFALLPKSPFGNDAAD